MSDKELLKEIVNEKIEAHKKAKNAIDLCKTRGPERCPPKRLKELQKIEKKKLKELKAAGKTLKSKKRKKRRKKRLQLKF